MGLLNHLHLSVLVKCHLAIYFDLWVYFLCCKFYVNQLTAFVQPVIMIFTVRLVGGSNSREGRLEVLYRGDWAAVCYDYYSSYRRAGFEAAARVVCAMLGFGYESIVPYKNG